MKISYIQSENRSRFKDILNAVISNSINDHGEDKDVC